MFSKACEYGIRATVIVAQHTMEGKRIRLKDVAKAINSPEAFTSKILQKLVKHKLMVSIQGVYGGFEIPEDKVDTLSLAHIVNAIDGEETYTACVLGLKECSDKNPCPAHKEYKYIKSDLVKMLNTMTIKEMVNDTQNGFAFLKIEKHFE